jgi:glutamate decarboxylase
MPTATLNFPATRSDSQQYYQFCDSASTVSADHELTVDNAGIRNRLIGAGYFDIMNKTQRISVVARRQAEVQIPASWMCRPKSAAWLGAPAYSMPPKAQPCAHCARRSRAS